MFTYQGGLGALAALAAFATTSFADPWPSQCTNPLRIIYTGISSTNDP